MTEYSNVLVKQNGDVVVSKQTLSAGCGVVEDSYYAVFVRTENPVSYWQCQEMSGNAQDSDGIQDASGYTGSAPLWRQPGALTSDCDFSMSYTGTNVGVDDACTMAMANVVGTATNNFSLETWLYIGSSSPSYGVSFFKNVGPGNGWIIIYDTNGKIRYEVDSLHFGSYSSTLANNAWTHFVVVREAGTWKYYINGVLDVANAGTDTPTTPTGIAVTAFTCANKLERIAHVAYYESALTDYNILQHYHSR